MSADALNNRGFNPADRRPLQHRSFRWIQATAAYVAKAASPRTPFLS